MIFINFKTYEESTGEKGLALLRTIEEASKTTKIPLIPVVTAFSLEISVKASSLPIWIQHVDPISFGAHTGSILPEEASRLGAKGTFLNHSEHKMELQKIAEAVKRALEVSLETLVFAGDIEELKRVLTLKPTYVSYEPPELVGSTTTSVSEAKPHVISEAADLCRDANIPLIVGAGIHSTKDVETVCERGAQGVAVATDVVKSRDPKASLQSLLLGFK